MYFENLLYTKPVHTVKLDPRSAVNHWQAPHSSESDTMRTRVNHWYCVLRCLITFLSAGSKENVASALSLENVGASHWWRMVHLLQASPWSVHWGEQGQLHLVPWHWADSHPYTHVRAGCYCTAARPQQGQIRPATLWNMRLVNDKWSREQCPVIFCCYYLLLLAVNQIARFNRSHNLAAIMLLTITRVIAG